MSNYNGPRRAVNVSQYIANLNTVPPVDEHIESPTNTNIEEDLALFTSNEFIDWNGDGSSGFGQSASGFDLNFEQQPADATGVDMNEPKLDFDINANFDFTDFNFQNPIVDQQMHPLPQTQPNHYPVPASFTSPPNTAVSPVGPGFDAAPGKKRKMSNLESQTQQSIDEAARQAAEEDKRRRNTAASARFRIKKKQREQALEKTAKEMSERVTMLETRIQQLETENTWLKSLITEKNGGKLSNPDISAMLKKREENSGERIDGNRTDGVGTKSDVKP